MMHSKPNFAAVIFDMDGTLLDTELLFKDIVYEVIDGFGLQMTAEIHRQMVGTSHEATAKLLMDSYGQDFPYAEFDRLIRKQVNERTEQSVPLKTGVLELLDQLQTLNIPLAVATSSRRQHAHHHLTTAGIFSAFDTIVTRDDVQIPKPNPEPYLLAAARLNVLPDACIAFEDSFAGVRAAHAAGMHTIMVPDLVHPNGEIIQLCHAVLDDLTHAPRHLMLG